MKINKFLIVSTLLLLFISCKHEEAKKQSSDSILLNEIKVQKDECKKDECKKDETDTIQPNVVNDVFSTPYDFLDLESYKGMIKEVLEYQKRSGEIDLDSAIHFYSDELIPVDTIVKWWKNIL